MKLSQEYPNFQAALDFLINDKNPVLLTNDAKKLSYFLRLYTFKNGFDYYELDRLPNGTVRFNLVTMLGLKVVVETNSNIYDADLTEDEWFDVIYKTSIRHFGKEEYTALKNNYVKKSSSYSGCMLTIILVISFSTLTYILN